MSGTKFFRTCSAEFVLNRTALCGRILLLACVVFGVPTYAHHTTEHTNQQLEYERQQREYWRQQEQKRQEEQRLRQLEQETVRRREEQAERERRQYQSRPDSSPKSSSDDSMPRRAGDSARSAGSSSSRDICKANPLRAGERNPLIGGQWRPVDAPTGDALTQLFQMAAKPQCAGIQAGIEFRERTHVGIVGEFPVEYGHKGDVWFACFPETVIGFRVEDANHIATIGNAPCRLRRVGAAQAQATAARSGTTASGAAAVSSGGAAAQSGAAVLAFAALAAAPSATSMPVAGSSFFVLRNSVEAVMAQAGIQPASGGSRLKAWSLACDSNAPACRQGANALLAASVAVTKTDASGRGRMPPVVPGSYYLFGTARTTTPFVWNVKVDLKPGDNSVVLDRSNAAPLN